MAKGEFNKETLFFFSHSEKCNIKSLNSVDLQ